MRAMAERREKRVGDHKYFGVDEDRFCTGFGKGGGICFREFRTSSVILY